MRLRRTRQRRTPHTVQLSLPASHGTGCYDASRVQEELPRKPNYFLLSLATPNGPAGFAFLLHASFHPGCRHPQSRPGRVQLVTALVLWNELLSTVPPHMQRRDYLHSCLSTSLVFPRPCSRYCSMVYVVPCPTTPKIQSRKQALRSQLRRPLLSRNLLDRTRRSKRRVHLFQSCHVQVPKERDIDCSDMGQWGNILFVACMCIPVPFEGLNPSNSQPIPLRTLEVLPARSFIRRLLSWPLSGLTHLPRPCNRCSRCNSLFRSCRSGVFCWNRTPLRICYTRTCVSH